MLQTVKAVLDQVLTVRLLEHEAQHLSSHQVFAPLHILLHNLDGPRLTYQIHAARLRLVDSHGTQGALAEQFLGNHTLHEHQSALLK